MSSAPRMDENSERLAFEMLLAKLNSNRDEAGKEYEKLREKIVKFIGWRGCLDPEPIFDEAIRRVSMKLLEGEEIENIRAFVYTASSNIHLESIRQHIHEEKAFAELARRHALRSKESEKQLRQKCYEKCLAALPKEKRDLMLAYYQKPKPADREQLAQINGVTLNTLHKRAFDIREQLKNCKADCIEAEGD